MPASQPITIVAEGYGGNMPEDQAYDLLDDIDFYYNKVKCRKIEKLLPVLNKLVIEEQKFLQFALSNASNTQERNESWLSNSRVQLIF